MRWLKGAAEKVTHGQAHWKRGVGRRVCTRVESWGGEMTTPFGWIGENLPDNTCDTTLHKRTRWYAGGVLFDEKVTEIEPGNKGDKQESLRVGILRWQ